MGFFWLSASIMIGGNGMHGGGSGGVSVSAAAGLNGVKLEGPGYYCNSYTPPDHGLLSSTYSECIKTY